jgi:hypothetical protein
MFFVSRDSRRGGGGEEGTPAVGVVLMVDKAEVLTIFF